MIFDPFGDFDSQGYLRNVLGSKDILEVKSLEYASFQRNINRAMIALSAIEFIEYKHVLEDPRNGYLDSYLKPFINSVIDRQQSASVLKLLKGLGTQ
jgi:cell filamentation protein